MKRILVIHPGALGDVLLALPAVTCLKRTFPRAELTLAIEPRLAGFFHETGVVDRAISLDSLSLHECFTDSPLSPETEDQLSAYDGIVSWFGSHDPTYRRHLEESGARILFARPAPPSPVKMHVGRWLLRTLEPWGIASFEISPPRLRVAEGAIANARRWIAGHGLSIDRLVAVHPGSGAEMKCWPAERFANLVNWIEPTLGGSVVLVEGPADATPVSSVLSHLERKPPVGHDFPLPIQAALLAEAKLFIGNDSGLTHLAAAVGAPTMALFGPTDPAIWAPLGPHVTVVAGRGDSADPWKGVTLERIQSATLSRWQSKKESVV